MYEYYGIKKLYDLSVIEPEKIYFYFHGKGMCNNCNNNKNVRTHYNINLTQSHVNCWRKALNAFKTNSEIIAAGMFPSEKLVFYNFFYARGNFLQSCGPPLKTVDRYYYECWLPQGDFSLGKIYNLNEDNFQYYNNGPDTDISHVVKAYINKFGNY